MTETAPPTEPPRRRVRWRRAPSKAAEWAAQAALIVFGVVMGLALNEWRGSIASAARTERVLDALAGEIESNRDGVREAVAYYGALSQAALAVEQTRGPDVAFDPGGLEGYRGDFGPALPAGTYQAATATGALLGVDILLAADLSETYTYQDAFRETLRDNRLTRLADPTPEMIKWRAYTIDQNGAVLIAAYDAVLDRLRDE